METSAPRSAVVSGTPLLRDFARREVLGLVAETIFLDELKARATVAGPSSSAFPSFVRYVKGLLSAPPPFHPIGTRTAAFPGLRRGSVRRHEQPAHGHRTADLAAMTTEA